MQKFDFTFTPKWLPWLKHIWGVTPENSFVEVDDNELRAHFGKSVATASLDNIESVEITRDYTPFRAIGIRIYAVRHGLSYCSNADAGVRMVFKKPIAGAKPFTFVKHPELTVTVTDVDGLAAALKR